MAPNTQNLQFFEGLRPITMHVTHGSTAAALIGLRSGAKILGQVLDSRLGAVARRSSGVHRDEVAIGNTATDIERILDLVQFATRASQNRRCSKLCLEGAGNGCVCVGLA
jgi:hypothetical protein